MNGHDDQFDHEDLEYKQVGFDVGGEKHVKDGPSVVPIGELEIVDEPLDLEFEPDDDHPRQHYLGGDQDVPEGLSKVMLPK